MKISNLNNNDIGNKPMFWRQSESALVQVGTSTNQRAVLSSTWDVSHSENDDLAWKTWHFLLIASGEENFNFKCPQQCRLHIKPMRGVEKNPITFHTEFCFNLSETQSESACNIQVSHSHLDLWCPFIC